MNISKLLRSLISYLQPGVVEGGGGGAAEPEQIELETAEEQDADPDAPEADDAPKEEVEGEEPDAPDDTGELVVTLGEETAANDEEEQGAQPWVKELRKQHREMARALRDKDAEIARLKGPGTSAAIVVGDRPKLSDPDIDFDEDKFGVALDAWMTRKAAADSEQRSKQQAEEAQRTKWTGRIDAVSRAASALKVVDQEEAQQAFEDLFSPVQQGIVLGGPDEAKTSALLRYALGKNPKRAKALASIEDPVKFAIAIGKLETELKVTTRKAVPPPDRVVRSSVSGSAAVDSRLKELEAQADKTGDRSKVAAYIRQKKQQQAA